MINHSHELCKKCGMCCDGTLFEYARLSKGENIEPSLKLFKTSHKDGLGAFKLPCAYHHSICSIYDQNKPDVCSRFKCKLLKKLEAESINFESACHIYNEVSDSKKRLYALLDKTEISIQDNTLRQVSRTLYEQKEDLIDIHGKKFFAGIELELSILQYKLQQHFLEEKDESFK